MIPDLIFMGTPDFAAPSLRELTEAGARILLVVTQPDRPKGRGKKPAAPPVKILARDLGIPVFQPEKARDPEVIRHIGSLGAECAVVVAYGQILSKAFLDLFPLGTLNVHASLLPRLRGAAPINRAILEGHTETGASIMLLDPGMDTGPVLSQRRVAIEESDSFGSVHDKLAQAGSQLLLQTLKEWKAGRIEPWPQDDRLATYAPPIRKEELRIRWDLPALGIVRTIRAFDPWPGAFTLYQGRRIKCFGARCLRWSGQGRAGEIVGHAEEGLVVLGNDGQALSIAELQMEGQRRMPSSDFLRGHAMPPGTMME